MVKKVLIVSYYIGNNFGVGGRRWLKYANQLAVNNYEVHLLSTKGNIDYSQLNHKIHIHEIKSNYPQVLNKVDFNLINKIHYKIVLCFLRITVKGTIYDKASRIEKKYIKKLETLIEDYDIKNIIVSGAPFNLMFYTTKIINNKLNLIFDFRDPWTWGIGYGMESLSKKRLDFEKQKESIVLGKKAKIISASNDLKIALDKKSLYKNRKSKVIINSVDDLTNKLYNKKFPIEDSKIILAHIGTIPLNTEKYWEHFINFLGTTKLLIECRFYGNNNTSFIKKLKNKRINNIVFYKRLSEDELRLELHKAHGALMFKMDAFTASFPSKFFDYIRSSLPILCFSKNGEFANEVKSNLIGHIFTEKTSYQKMESIISDLLNDSKKYYSNYNKEKFSVEFNVEEVEKLLE